MTAFIYFDIDWMAKVAAEKHNMPLFIAPVI